MPPQQPYVPQPVAPPQNNYDFIINPQQPKRSFGLNFSNMSGKSLAILVGGVIVFLIILIAALNAAKSPGLGPALTSLAQTQQEIARVAGEVNNQTTQQSTLNFATSTQASLISEENQLTSYLTSNGLQLSSSTLALGQNSKTDTSLQQAESASNFDSVFLQIMASELASYHSQIASIFYQTKNAVLAEQLRADYRASGLLLDQAKNPNLANG